MTNSGGTNIASVANRRIGDFVHQRANLNLRPGTSYYSTPFRGGLFGEVEAADVAKQLSRRGVDVLWLGTNPCVPGSLDNIINPPRDKGTSRVSKGRSNLASSAHRGGDQAGSLRRISTRLKRQ